METYYEEQYGHKYVCVVIEDTPDKLVVQKTDIFTGEVKYERYVPNPKIDKNHTHEWNSSKYYGAHGENTPSSIKRKLKHDD